MTSKAKTLQNILIKTLFVLSLMLLPYFVLASVNINTASVSELMTLNGIGEVKAEAIIDYRKNNGSFSSIDEIINVSGIGEATFNNIKGDITVGSVTSSSGEDEDDDNYQSDSISLKTTTSDSPIVPVSGLTITVPKIAFVGLTSSFSVEPQEGTDNRLVRYLWNFGDATSVGGKEVNHIYKHTGKYLVTVESYYNKETLTKTQEITVVKPDIEITRNIDGVSVKNKTKYDIDLSGLSLVGSLVFVFPKYSVILSGSELVIDNDLVGGGEVVLMSQGGVVARETAAEASPLPPSPSNQTFSSGPIIQIASTTKTEPVSTDVSINNTASVINSETTKDTNTTWPYVGLVGVLSLATLAVYSGKIF